MKKRGIVLVLVLAFAALVAIAGFAAMDANSTAYPEALNLRAAARARNMAASGIAMATHYLRVPPTSVTAGNYWSGATGVSIDGTSDSCDISVVRSATLQQDYTITATGYARDSDGSLRGQKTITTEVVTPPPKTWTLARAFYNATQGITVPSRINITGDFYARGNITFNGNCGGNVMSTGTITWAGGGGASLTQNAPAITLPVLDASQWNRYVVYGVVKQAATFSGSTLGTANVSALPGGQSSMTVCFPSTGSEGVVVVDLLGTLLGGSGGLGDAVTVVTSTLCLGGTSVTGATCISQNNPGGVIVVNSDVSVSAGTYLGTLVVNGNLTLSAGVTWAAMPYYPAFVATGNITINGGSSASAIRGPIFCGGNFAGTSPRNYTLYGATLAYGTGMASTFAQTQSCTYTFQAGWGSVYDFSLGSFSPMTLLKWQE